MLGNFSKAALGLLAMSIAGVVSAQDVLINEYDTQTSSDEFIELYNPTGAPIDLAAGQYGLVFVNGNGIVIYQSANLTGTIAAGGYYVVTENSPATAGDQTFGATSFQNGVDAVALVKGADVSVDFGGSGDYSDKLALSTATQVDAIVYGSPDDAALLAEMGQTVQLPATTVSRVTDGQGGAAYALTDWGTGSITNGATNSGITAFAAGPVTAADIDEALAQGDGTAVTISGTVTVVAPVINVLAGRNQFFIQDASGTDSQSAILVDDVSGTVTATVAVGDTITGFEGTMGSFGGVRQFVPSADPTVVTGGAAPAPLLVTGSITDRDTILSELISLESIDIAETGTFAADTTYVITSGAAGLVISEIRVEDGSTLVGEPIPTGPFNLVGVCGQFGANGQIQPRFASDLSASTTVGDWNTLN